MVPIALRDVGAEVDRMSVLKRQLATEQLAQGHELVLKTLRLSAADLC